MPSPVLKSTVTTPALPLVRITVIVATAMLSDTSNVGWLKPTRPRPNSLSTMVSVALVWPVRVMGVRAVTLVAPNSARLIVRFALVSRSSMIPTANVLPPVSPFAHVSTPAALV
ncbi:hypothetical protein LBMAG56_02450 [Verrucomicrobiota bacterium]|nr:hypothetical protein LBMAG56_02450 [Verrucomicrobiota bacterium]